MSIHPEASVALLPGGFLVHTAREEGEDVVQDPHIFASVEEALSYIAEYLREAVKKEKELDSYVL